MSTQATTQNATATFSRAERRAMRAVRARFQGNRDLFSPRELARLQFLRWLYRSSHLDAADGAVALSR